MTKVRSCIRRHPAIHLVIASWFVVPMMTGCDQSSSEPVATENALRPATESRVVSEGEDRNKVEVTQGNIAEFQSELEGAIGNVVLVDFWASWCGPCVQQLPHSVKLHETYRDQGLKVMTVSMDEPESLESVHKLLKSNHATCFNLLTPYGASEEFATSFDILGDLPFYKLYDRTGKLRYTFSDNPDGNPICEPVDRIDLRVSELLAENPS